jgi:protein-ribulosamine 3-kinase
MIAWKAVVVEISRVTGVDWDPSSVQPARAGDTAGAITLTGAEGQRCFVKHAHASRLAMFEAEADGLAAIAASGAIRTPRVMGIGVAARHAFLALEHLNLGPLIPRSETVLGHQLAALHQHTAAAFGWHRNNYIGRTPQSNRRSNDWVDFFRFRRLAPQLQLAEKNQPGAKIVSRAHRLLSEIDHLFDGYSPVPSLLHGDLWQGNAASIDGDVPTIFDPAVYAGDRETDIAMTELFGGFSTVFYEAYNDAWALDSGYAVRRELYKLYHVLNHANIFGGGYWSKTKNMIDWLLSEMT